MTNKIASHERETLLSEFALSKSQYLYNKIAILKNMQEKRRNMYEKKNAFYYFQIWPFLPEKVKFLKYANCSNCNVIHSSKFLTN